MVNSYEDVLFFCDISLMESEHRETFFLLWRMLHGWVIFLMERPLAPLFEMSGIDYLTKPLRAEEFDAMVKKLITKFRERRHPENLFSIPLKKISAVKNNRYFLVDLESLLYFYAGEAEIKIVVNDNSIYYVNHPLRFWEEKLQSENFFRCHKGYLVNLQKIVEIAPSFNSTLLLHFANHKNTVPVGRTYIKQFKERINW